MWIVFKVIHVSAILFAIGCSLGPELLMYRIARSRDVPAIRAAFTLAAPLLKAAPVLFMLGLVTGSATVWAGGWSFRAPWLVLSYALFLLMIFLNLRFRAPWVNRVLTLSQASSSEEPSAELRSILSDTRGKVHMLVAPVAILMQVVLMIVKPFG